MSAFDQPKLAFSARRFLRVALAAFVILVVALLLERWRGQHALAVWQRAMTAQGEVFDLAQLWPPASASASAFSNRLTQAAIQLPTGFKYYGGTMQGIVEERAGKARRGSQEPWPLVHSPHGTNSWEALDAAARQSAPTLQIIRELMKDPPTGAKMDILKQVAKGSLYSYVSVRENAQALYGASLNELHHGNLAGALRGQTRKSFIIHSTCRRIFVPCGRARSRGLGVS